MKLVSGSSHQGAAFPIILSGLICCCILTIASPAGCKDSIAEERISLDVKDQPLGEVLEDLSAETGYRFRIDERWNNFPVTASMKNEPLHQGLKRILRNLNNAVIYGSDKTIRIKIYDQQKAFGLPAGQPLANRSNEGTEYPPVISVNSQSSTPEDRARNRSRLEQSDEQTTEEYNESDSEPVEAADTNEETVEQPETANSEDAKVAEPQSVENASEEDGGKATKTAAASDTASESDTGGNE